MKGVCTSIVGRHPIIGTLRHVIHSQLPESNLEIPAHMDKRIDLIRQLDAGDIALPIMQRDYVWKPLKVERLLDSLYHGWPVGSFYLWRPGKKQPKKDHHLKKEVSGEPVRYLLH